MAESENQAAAQSQEDVIAEICKLAKIPSDKISAFSSGAKSIVRQYAGKTGEAGRLPYQKELLPPLKKLAERLTALDEVLPDILRELRTLASEPWRLSRAAEHRAGLLDFGFGDREADLDVLEDQLRLMKKATEAAIRGAAGYPERGRQHESPGFMHVSKSLLLQAQLYGGNLTFHGVGGVAEGPFVEALRLLRPFMPSVIPEDPGAHLKTLEIWRKKANKDLKKFPP